MALRGIRGAITVSTNTPEAILAAAERLLKEIIQQNRLVIDDIASIIFTATDDLNAAFPAEAVRNLGLIETPLLCAREINVKTGLKMCLRVLLQVNSQLPQAEIKHVYLEKAKALRPDLSKE